MNLLILGAVGAGIYFLSQQKSKPTFGHASTNLPKDIFIDKFWGSGPKGYSFNLINGKLIKSSNFDKHLEYVVDEVTAQGDPINGKFLDLLCLRDEKKLKGLEWLYEKDYKFVNNIYHEYLILIINTLNTDEDKTKMVNMLPNLFAEYFKLLEKSGVPEEKWPGQELKGI